MWYLIFKHIIITHTYRLISQWNLLQLTYLLVFSIIPSYFRVYSKQFTSTSASDLLPSFVFENFILSYRFFDLCRVFGKCFILRGRVVGTYLWHEVKGVRFLPGVVGGDCFVTRCLV